MDGETLRGMEGVTDGGRGYREGDMNEESHGEEKFRVMERKRDTERE